MRRYPSNVAGLAFPGKDGTHCFLAASLLREGDVVALERDPGNAHDPDAIAIFADDLHLGYVPKRHLAWIGEQIDSGRPMRVTVDTVHRTGGRVTGVDLHVDLGRAGEDLAP